MSWYVRIKEQVKSATSAVFVTLTYDESSLPHDLEGNACVSKKDVQLFFKRLRKKEPYSRIWYFLCSEYGPETLRPHYHFILGNCQELSNIEKAWPFGFVTIGELNDNRIKYVAKYMITKAFAPDYLVPTFSLCSKRIGLDYVDKMTEWHNSNPLEKFYVPYFDKRLPLPRYYKDKIFSDRTRRLYADTCTERAFERHDELLDSLGSEESVHEYEQSIVREFKRRLRNKLDKSQKL